MTIYCAATKKDDSTVVVPVSFHDVCISMYIVDKEANIMPVDEDSELPELHSRSGQITYITELGGYTTKGPMHTISHMCRAPAASLSANLSRP